MIGVEYFQKELQAGFIGGRAADLAGEMSIGVGCGNGGPDAAFDAAWGRMHVFGELTIETAGHVVENGRRAKCE